ncbi:acyl-CoA dehydrogenase family protein [Sphingobium phenoxybenzoativorans]|uniref:acyl-CoA dehydrogenase family protein n=1 Tax=Sphingobium phenoxybenzoativorans TaxID=1592790 RepID=UPI0008731E50|nr:acyl-CoA dehydrogenase family protein [Sphingobium phenoxybenzoativorans]
MTARRFPLVAESAEAAALRKDVREFLAVEIADRPPVKRAETWTGADPSFSAKLGARGWLGMTWPKRYGGHERSALERYVVIEELLAAGAPVAAHWIADRQSGPTLLRFGTEAQRSKILPAIARGECFFCIGMSEPDAGSDLAAVRTRAVRESGGWRINGTKLWTTNGHLAHYMILLARTDSNAEGRHDGLSQFLVDMKAPGVTVRPIYALSGEHEFNEVHFEDALVPEDALLGQEGEGWKQVMSELAHERSGPERFLSSFILMAEMARAAGPGLSDRAAEALGRLAAHVAVLRAMSRSVAGQLEQGGDPSLQAVIVKDLGAVLEQEIPEVARSLTDPALWADPDFRAVLSYLTLNSVAFSLRGGAREILRGIIARGLGLR